MNNIRVRFAPSPTGYLHVGGARTALCNWLFARHTGGVLILRIEDTDVDRSKPELTTAILESLEWLGLNWDEGPIYQSQRLDRYREMVLNLERSGHAYPCFCTQEELQAKRVKAEAELRAWKYDGACRVLTQTERERLRAEGRPAAVRFRVPDSGQTSFEDQVFGHIEVAHQDLEDFVLLRSDGHPTYHLGVVADDLDLRITHVIRGADHISNTPKQILMYQALDAPVPIFAHLPLILGPDKQRLSKRHGATSVGAYREQGVLPEALVNFLALLGWTPPGQKEIAPIEEMIRDFDLAAVSKSNAVFDLEKLAWMNSEYVRHLPAEQLLPLVERELAEAGLGTRDSRFSTQEEERFRQTILLLQSRARTLKDFPGAFRAFFTDDFAYDPDAVKKFWKEPALSTLLDTLADRLAATEPFDLAGTETTLRSLAEEKGVKAGLLINATRLAVTGQGVAPSLFDVMLVLGRDRVTSRLHGAATHLRSG
ncbi:MAG TPA: glutamate--tRNA ligase [Terriglobia bacterium]|nr:glutamate--tRNA ligase [Terriglobia bacterium]